MTWKRLRHRWALPLAGCALLWWPADLVAEEQPAQLRCELAEMAGTWAGRRIRFPGDADAKVFTLTFNQNGTYSYTAGQNGVTWTAHNGQFSIGRGTDEPSQRYPCLIKLQPARETVTTSAANRSGELPLGLRTLGQDRERLLRFRRSSSGTGILVIDASATEWRNDIESFGLVPTRGVGLLELPGLDIAHRPLGSMRGTPQSTND